MNWKEHANLFANGKFRVKSPVIGDPEDIFEVSGYDQERVKAKGWKNHFMITPEGYQCNLDHCTLIARRIEDLTEEELREILQADGFQDEDMSRAIDEGRTDIVLEFIRSSFEGALELLDRGVYPGPQSHFGETVIDINEV